jgi:hypothetical protein
MLSIPAVVLTAIWVAIVSAILVLFGRTVGGGWSIAGSVARGVRDWAGNRAGGRRVVSTSPRSAGAALPAARPSDRAELEELR